MPPFLLASASTTVKIWDFVPSSGKSSNDSTGSGHNNTPSELNQQLVSSFAPTNSVGVSSIRWSHDNQIIAVASRSNILTIHNSTGKLLEQIPPPDSDSDYAIQPGALHFASRSRYLLFGDADGIVHIWDRKDRIYIDALDGGHGSQITGLSLNVDETLCATCGLGGDVVIFEAQDSQTGWNGSATEFHVPTDQPLRALEFSHFKRTLLALAGDDGSLYLFDTTNHTPLHIFSAVHHSSIRGLAFSPFNRYLMATAGLDRRMCLYDVEKKAVVKKLETGMECSALAFKSDGITVAVGGSQGKILLYDLRSTQKPVCSFTAYEGAPVQLLRFQEKSKSSSATAATGAPQQPRRSASTSSHVSGPSSRHSNVTDTFVTTKSSATNAPVTRPRKASMTLPASNQTTIIDTISASTPPSNFSSSAIATNNAAFSTSLDFPSNDTKTYPTDALLDMFSPIKSTHEQISPDGGIVNDLPGRRGMSGRESYYGGQAKRLSGTGSFGTGVKLDGSGADLDMLSPLKISSILPNVNTTETQSSGPMPLASISDHASKRLSSSRWDEIKREKRISAAVNSGQEKKENDIVGERLEELKDRIAQRVSNEIPLGAGDSADFDWTLFTKESNNIGGKKPVLGDGDALEQLPKQTSTRTFTSRHSLPFSASSQPEEQQPSSQTFQTALLENIIDESLHEFRQTLKIDIQNMHLELLRQFIFQRNEMEVLFQRYCSEQAELRTEVERLREENLRLRARYSDL